MRKILIALILMPFISWGQEMDTTLVDTVEKVPPPYYLGVYGVGGAYYEPSTPSSNFVSGIGFGIQYEKWMVEFTQHDFLGVYETSVVFPNVFELKYRFGGISAGYRLVDSPDLGIWMKGGYYQGDMTWRNLVDQEDFLRDEFQMVKVGLRGEYLKVRYIKPYVEAGYQQMRGLNLAETDAGRFSGFHFGVGVRVGYFNQ